MKIVITPEAEEQMRKKIGDDHHILRLKYETDGCGCAVSGVPTLQIVDQGELDREEDIKVETNAMDIYMEKSKLVFFDEELKIDFSPKTQSLRLISPNQIFNGRMSCNR
ncbi:iron-sulfur cluster biosynthesis family protein [Lederbergia sp. NSJ-179]|uniref:iron-sulfur cluster biosynthesis family protein n=1 Tax=Lederbergia sp. NSJ-179 TaxID=2931402 RepID=UPI001FD385B2|nr:iron-sulfur cluster biosynthesis family protein [Lederbergia sp. NSJ-179]MCJ7839392.1 iron-sulfur cluster biosynthesis family protein [Lederbergia sp. NSJ-179]